MKILLVDDDLNIKNFLKVIEQKSEYEVTFSNYTLEQYREENFDIVIIDFTRYFEFYKQIIELNPQQKLIVIAENLDCANMENCENCKHDFRKKRLLKPIQTVELYNLIQNFDIQECRYSITDTFKNIKPVLSDILRKFSHYSYCEDTDSIFIKDENLYTNSAIQELLDITSLLTNYNIQYNVIDAKNIKLL